MDSKLSFLRFRTKVLFALTVVALTFSGTSILPTTTLAQTTLGPGSFTTVRPEACKPLQQQIFKDESLDGPTPTNQWWSSLVWERFSHNLFAHPMGMVACEDGLSISYPGAAIVAAESAIMGEGVSPNGDIVIGIAGATFDDARLQKASGWFITTRFSSPNADLKTSFGHGSPFVYGSGVSGKVRLKFAVKPEVWHGGEESATVGVTVRGNHYGLFGPRGSHWSIENDSTMVLDSTKDYFSIALLPDRDTKTLEQFRSCAHNHVTESSFDFRFEDGYLVTELSLRTDPKEPAKSDDTLTALYPHQWKYSSDELTGQSYKSVRGEMKLRAGTSFSTRVPIQGTLPLLPPQGIPDRKRMLDYLDAELAKPTLEFKDTYWEGKHLGKLASLSGICESLGESERQEKLIAELKRRLENWFVASEGETATLFYYDENWGTLIGSRPSYGSDVELNDHHFHYGYFIRAAAEIARVDQAWGRKWAPMVKLLIEDIAAPSATERFPQLRGFDLYAGHSWASGHARFGDGNNQESSSESLNAWYGMMLWGEAMGDDRTRDLGAFLFNTERTAVEEYWLDVSGSNFPKAFPHTAIGMVWGGKGAFATWFSGDVDKIHGINWLPFTPASVYLGRFPDYVKQNYDSVARDRKNGSDLNKGWGDLLVMFGALYDPEPAAMFINANPDCHLEGGNSHAFMYHWIHTLNEIGTNDASVTADYLFANVFVRNGRRTYVIYNFHDRPLEVTFSDGTKLTSSRCGMVVK
ncbi:glycosyl hydrolase [Mariniblastus fucicola]|uniref:glucan endo-1,3-beta-D-glucosidase n=1 Tax=Mariniblastus fucicola TaxID=980251 RepID=A0A5B9PBE7_9BACT|nr:glycosyl hydrolase [Mariniblastus fucicola]QEG22525.1 Glycosyl hydrolase family 81 [Mariniblastus fucicola]